MANGTEIIYQNVRRASVAIVGSLPNTADLVAESLAKDLEEELDSETQSTNNLRHESRAEDQVHTGIRYDLINSHRRLSFAGAGNRSIVYGSLLQPATLTHEERQRILHEEQQLLRDNGIIPSSQSSHDRRPPNEALGDELIHNEASPLLGRDSGVPPVKEDNSEEIKQAWAEAVDAGNVHTTWQRELKVLFGYASPLVAVFLLQYSLNVVPIFVVGHIGTVELGAVSLAAMSANITGYAIYQGLATSLDTLCAQAYGSGRYKLVGLQLQRMTYFLWLITIPIGILWLLADKVLQLIVPEPEIARLTGLYLKIVLLGAPGFATFEAGKRYVQAQGLFSASLYVLIVCAPINAFLNWVFVWYLGMGFPGAPLAVAITDNLLPLGLFIYVRLSKTGMSCWDGFSRRAFTNWGPMIRLALPGLVMVEAEMFAFEILTFVSSYFGTTALASQSVLANLASIIYQIPFPLSIAGSTRVANLIGATLTNAARISTYVTFTAAAVVGAFNVVVLTLLRNQLPRLFTNDVEVLEIVSKILPFVASCQLFDAMAACCNGILRGLGRQELGGHVQLFCYYVIAMPLSLGTAFGLGWEVWGLWTGVAVALIVVVVIEFTYLHRFLDWEKSVEEAQARNREE